ncbi:hypothetical protein [Aliarcobacter butzleri]|uniref:hypothetical protein n=1 Tax=Aliarcobacter butzleri TaxID=28197 RepID=UPI00126A5098|nr:hypothetical protein [Aliarcobacter butzleri]
MKKIVKTGLVSLGFVMMLNASDKIEEKIVSTHEVNSLREAAKNYAEIEANKEVSSLSKESIKPINKKQVNEESNIKSINYITNPNGTIDVKIDLSSNELNLTTIDTLKSIITSIKKSKNVEKVYIDIDSVK